MEMEAPFDGLLTTAGVLTTAITKKKTKDTGIKEKKKSKRKSGTAARQKRTHAQDLQGGGP